MWCTASRSRLIYAISLFLFFFQAEDGIRDYKVTGVQTCALPIYAVKRRLARPARGSAGKRSVRSCDCGVGGQLLQRDAPGYCVMRFQLIGVNHKTEIGRASCRERVEISGGAGSFKKKKKCKERK